MKKRSTSQGAFFNPRVLIGFALCSAGVLLALAVLTKSVTGMSTATGTANPVPLINQPLIPDAVAPGGGSIHSHGEWHGLCVRLSGELERQRADYDICE